jgi:hypothetical protein
MPRWELILWLLFVMAQPPAVVFFVVDALADSDQGTGRPWLVWTFLTVDAALLALGAWRLGATRRPPDPSGRYARRMRASRSRGDE